MDENDVDQLEVKDGIYNSFRLIENIFKIMDTSSPEVYGKLTSLYSEIGIALCRDFRSKLDAVFEIYYK